jgi:uncharacterized membrane protein YqjE
MSETGYRSFGDVFQDAVGHMQEIVRAEIRLAKSELQVEARKAKQAGLMFGGAALLGYFAMALLVVAALCALAIVLPWWAAALIMAGLCGVIAGVMFAVGRMRLKTIHGPEQTVGTVSENLTWARNQTH